LHRYQVGTLYDPSRRSWPECADYNYRAGGHELRLFLNHASKPEMVTIRSGRVGFGLLVDLLEMYVITRFHDHYPPRVRMSFACSYQWHMMGPTERVLPPAWEEVNPATRALCHIIVIEATSGQIRALRPERFSPAFTGAIHQAITDQAAMPFDRASHIRRVEETTARYTTAELWARCSIYCEGGDYGRIEHINRQ
jgi:hypothetical protein